MQATFHQPFASVVQQSPYPKGTVLDTFLRLPEIKDFAAKCPLLETLTLEYQPPMFLLDVDNTGVYAPYSYFIIAEFVRKDREHEYTEWPIYRAPSGLDLQMTVDGKKTKAVDFPSGDTFGKISPFNVSGESTGGPALGAVIKRTDSRPRAAERPHNLRTAYSIADLRSFPATTTALSIQGTSITGKDISTIARFQGLTYLDMSQCEGDPNEFIRESDLQVIGRLHGLRSLKLNSVSVTDRLCAAISRLQDLTSLTLSGGSITDAGVLRLARLPDLETLEIPYCRHLTNASLRTIGAMHHLKRLNILSSGDYSNAGLKNLAGLKQLQELTMGNLSRVTAKGFAFLPRLPALTTLFLGYMPLHDEALAYISPLKRLITLDLLEIGSITDSGILKLCTLDSIEWLGIQDCPKVTHAGIDRLREALPPPAAKWIVE